MGWANNEAIGVVLWLLCSPVIPDSGSTAAWQGKWKNHRPPRRSGALRRSFVLTGVVKAYSLIDVLISVNGASSLIAFGANTIPEVQDDY